MADMDLVRMFNSEVCISEASLVAAVFGWSVQIL